MEEEKKEELNGNKDKVQTGEDVSEFTLATFSIRFSMGNCKPHTAKMSSDHGLAVTFAVCSSRLNRSRELPAVSDLRQGFLPQKNCTASRLKV